MTSSARTSISALPRGYEIAAASFTLSAEDVRAYLAAVGDTSDYGDRVPPLAAVALGLAALQEQLYLPVGSLHTGQEVEQAQSIAAGAEITLTGRVAQRSERQGFVITVIEFEIAHARSTAVRARTTIMAPGTAA
jgi:hypothetical protein